MFFSIQDADLLLETRKKGEGTEIYYKTSKDNLDLSSDLLMGKGRAVHLTSLVLMKALKISTI